MSTSLKFHANHVAGFESLGVVVAKGKSAKLNVGQAVAISGMLHYV